MSDLFYSDAISVELLRSAVAEIRRRLIAGDVESSISMCVAAEIALAYGVESPEMKAHIAIEEARFS